jgi:hypothetical protein
MRGSRTPYRAALAAVVLAAAAGCHTGPPRRTASAEPGLGDPGATVVEGPPAGTQLTWIDRHPLFYKPRDYYDSSGDNTLVKTAAATFIGVPAGIFGELKQVVSGAGAAAGGKF